MSSRTIYAVGKIINTLIPHSVYWVFIIYRYLHLFFEMALHIINRHRIHCMCFTYYCTTKRSFSIYGYELIYYLRNNNRRCGSIYTCTYRFNFPIHIHAVLTVADKNQQSTVYFRFRHPSWRPNTANSSNLFGSQNSTAKPYRHKDSCLLENAIKIGIWGGSWCVSVTRHIVCASSRHWNIYASNFITIIMHKWIKCNSII